MKGGNELLQAYEGPIITSSCIYKIKRDFSFNC